MNKKEIESIIEEVLIDVINDMLFEEIVPTVPTKRRLRRVDGNVQLVRKRKKPIPMSQRTISKAAAKRRGRKSAIGRKSKQKIITKLAVKTTKKGRQRGLYK